VTALHIFDMDGTLLRETTASREISRRLGHTATLETLETTFAAGQLTTAEFAVAIHRLWDELTDDLVADVVAAAPWIDGIEEVCADITDRGETAMLISMSPDFFAHHLYNRGLHIIHASRFPPLPFTTPIDPGGILTPTDKIQLTETERARRGLATTACVAYGDSLSDEPLFTTLDNTVAVNADQQLEAIACRTYRGHDLREAYTHGRTLLDNHEIEQD